MEKENLCAITYKNEKIQMYKPIVVTPEVAEMLKAEIDSPRPFAYVSADNEETLKIAYNKGISTLPESLFNGTDPENFYLNHNDHKVVAWFIDPSKEKVKEQIMQVEVGSDLQALYKQLGVTMVEYVGIRKGTWAERFITQPNSEEEDSLPEIEMLFLISEVHSYTAIAESLICDEEGLLNWTEDKGAFLMCVGNKTEKLEWRPISGKGLIITTTDNGSIESTRMKTEEVLNRVHVLKGAELEGFGKYAKQFQ